MNSPVRLVDHDSKELLIGADKLPTIRHESMSKNSKQAWPDSEMISPGSKSRPMAENDVPVTYRSGYKADVGAMTTRKTPVTHKPMGYVSPYSNAFPYHKVKSNQPTPKVGPCLMSKSAGLHSGSRPKTSSQHPHDTISHSQVLVGSQINVASSMRLPKVYLSTSLAQAQQQMTSSRPVSMMAAQHPLTYGKQHSSSSALRPSPTPQIGGGVFGGGMNSWGSNNKLHGPLVIPSSSALIKPLVTHQIPVQRIQHSSIAGLGSFTPVDSHTVGLGPGGHLQTSSGQGLSQTSPDLQMMMSQATSSLNNVGPSAFVRHISARDQQLQHHISARDQQLQHHISARDQQLQHLGSGVGDLYGAMHELVHEMASIKPLEPKINFANTGGSRLPCLKPQEVLASWLPASQVVDRVSTPQALLSPSVLHLPPPSIPDSLGINLTKSKGIQHTPMYKRIACLAPQISIPPVLPGAPTAVTTLRPGSPSSPLFSDSVNDMEKQQRLTQEMETRLPSNVVYEASLVIGSMESETMSECIPSTTLDELSRSSVTNVTSAPVIPPCESSSHVMDDPQKSNDIQSIDDFKEHPFSSLQESQELSLEDSQSYDNPLALSVEVHRGVLWSPLTTDGHTVDKLIDELLYELPEFQGQEPSSRGGSSRKEDQRVAVEYNDPSTDDVAAIKAASSEFEPQGLSQTSMGRSEGKLQDQAQATSPFTLEAFETSLGAGSIPVENEMTTVCSVENGPEGRPSEIPETSSEAVEPSSSRVEEKESLDVSSKREERREKRRENESSVVSSKTEQVSGQWTEGASDPSTANRCLLDMMYTEDALLTDSSAAAEIDSGTSPVTFQLLGTDSKSEDEQSPPEAPNSSEVCSPLIHPYAFQMDSLTGTSTAGHELADGYWSPQHDEEDLEEEEEEDLEEGYSPVAGRSKDFREGEAHLMSVSAKGYSMIKRIPSEGTLGPLHGPTENDRVVNGVRILGQKYEVQHVVGEGAYGLVMKCKVVGSDDQHVAIKSFKIEDDDPDAEDVKRTSKREVALLNVLQHQHVVGLVDQFYVRDRLFIVMEFVPCNLLELLEGQPGGMDHEAIRLIMFQLCSVMAFIHSKNVVYRDIKPENVLVDEHGCLKLCDFGFARYLNKPGESLTDYVATRWYRAPELLLGPPWDDGDEHVQFMYGPPIDMWAVGCLMGELIDGEPLFPGDSDLDQLYKVQQMIGSMAPEHQEMFDRNPQNTGIYFNFKDRISLSKRYENKMDSLEIDFLTGLLCMDPKMRLSGEQALKHPYLAQLAGVDVINGQVRIKSALSTDGGSKPLSSGAGSSPLNSATSPSISVSKTELGLDKIEVGPDDETGPDPIQQEVHYDLSFKDLESQDEGQGVSLEGESEARDITESIADHQESALGMREDVSES